MRKFTDRHDVDHVTLQIFDADQDKSHHFLIARAVWDVCSRKKVNAGGEPPHATSAD
jgi:hypothetical protein